MTAFVSHRDPRFWLLAIFAGLFVAAYSLAPQIHLWCEKGRSWNGVYALHDFDEIAYTAYVQSLIDGKPRINSPYTGAKNADGQPQKESLFSVQFLAFYPIALSARLLGLSSSTSMIFLSAIIGFLSGLALFWLFHLFLDDPLLSAVGTLIVFSTGALIAGQGSIVAGYAPSNIFYFISFPFAARRVVPAMGYPALFLFFAFVWKLITTESSRARAVWTAIAFLAFVFLVFTYFYLWTSAAAWFGCLTLTWLILRVEDRRRLIIPLFILGALLCAVLVPYFVMLGGRGETVDSIQLLFYTHQPDLWRVPEVLAIVTILGFVLARVFGWIGRLEPKIIFLLSFLLVPIVVFNQQVITGRSLQPIHYEFYVANYLVAIGIISLAFYYLSKKVNVRLRNLISIFLIAAALFISYSDAQFAHNAMGATNAARDELMPVAEKIRTMSGGTSTVLSFDLYQLRDGQLTINCSDDLPALSSQAVLWSPHQKAFSDLTPEESVNRLLKFLYYQNLSPEWLRSELQRGRNDLVTGFFGWGRTSNTLTLEHEPLTDDEINETVSRYEQFRTTFNYEDAYSPVISYLITHEAISPDLSAVDKWYQRDHGEKVGKYFLYRLEPRNH